MKLLEALNWRYATKRMTGEKLDQHLVDQIVEAARLAPTSSGLQQFRILVIKNKELEQKYRLFMIVCFFVSLFFLTFASSIR